jgi:hypothetical protein
LFWIKELAKRRIVMNEVPGIDKDYRVSREMEELMKDHGWKRYELGHCINISALKNDRDCRATCINALCDELNTLQREEIQNMPFETIDEFEAVVNKFKEFLGRV